MASVCQQSLLPPLFASQSPASWPSPLFFPIFLNRIIRRLGIYGRFSFSLGYTDQVLIYPYPSENYIFPPDAEVFESMFLPAFEKSAHLYLRQLYLRQFFPKKNQEAEPYWGSYR